MFISKANLAVAAAASSDLTRFATGSVLIEADGKTVATDGHILAMVGGLPANTSAPAMAVPFEPCLIPARAALDLGKQIRKPFTTAEIAVPESNLNGSIIVQTNGTATHTVAKDQNATADRFPDYAAVIPSGDAVWSAGFKVQQLAQALGIAKDAGLKFVRIAALDEHQPIKLTGTNADGQAVLLLVMPYPMTPEQE